MKNKSHMMAPAATNHELQDRRVLTEDMLKISEHTLRKELQARQNALIERLDKLRNSADDIAIDYNMALVKCFVPHMQEVSDGVGATFHYINACESRLVEDDHEQTLTVKFALSPGQFISIREKDDHDMIKRMKKICPWFSHTPYSSHQLVKSIAGDCADDSSGDLVVDIQVVVFEADSPDESVFDKSFSVAVTCTAELEQARLKIVEHQRQVDDLEAQISKVGDDITRIPSMLSELDVAATAIRVRDAGGEQCLAGIMDGVRAILDGGAVDGMLLAGIQPTKPAEEA